MIRVPLNASTLGTEEIDAAIAVLRSDRVTMGSRCEEFERIFAGYVGVGHAIMVNSGSSANLLAMFALVNALCPPSGGRRRLKPGDEVIVPAVTWSTTVWPIVQAGCVPRFVDSDPNTLQVRPETIEAAISDKTRAIFLVHILGNAVDTARIRAIAKERGLWILEDTCESLGVRRDGRFAGTTGDIGTYSFYFSHHITTIEGGMVVTNDDDMADLLRALRAHGWVRNMKQSEKYRASFPDVDPRFMFITTGFNVRPTEINAAIGIPQLAKLAGYNSRRASLYTALCKALDTVISAGRLRPMSIEPGVDAAPFGFPVVCDSVSTRKGLQDHLEARGIETRPIICGNMTRQPAIRTIEHSVSGRLSGADRIMDCGLYWGLHPMMPLEDLDFTARSVLEYFSA